MSRGFDPVTMRVAKDIFANVGRDPQELAMRHNVTTRQVLAVWESTGAQRQMRLVAVATRGRQSSPFLASRLASWHKKMFYHSSGTRVVDGRREIGVIQRIIQHTPYSKTAWVLLGARYECPAAFLKGQAFERFVTHGRRKMRGLFVLEVRSIRDIPEHLREAFDEFVVCG